MDSSARTRRLKACAKELGFHDCRIARASTLPQADQFEHWLTEGYQADMGWMDNTKAIRLDPHQKLEHVNSIVVVCQHYYHPRPEPLPESGRVARYAWGRDYHKIIKKKLVTLGKQFAALVPGVAWYASVDTGPVQERAWAAQSGLGWVGKNSLILRKDIGSWFFLGTLMTSAILEYDQPVSPHCGSCTACMDACPTGAIVTPGMVDSNRCIAYHTIENRGDIPAPIQAALGNWVFGCDICQDVCPWNRMAAPPSVEAYAPTAERANPLLSHLLSMSEAAFQEEFQGTPVRRAGYSGIQRNARYLAAGGIPPQKE